MAASSAARLRATRGAAGGAGGSPDRDDARLGTAASAPASGGGSSGRRPVDVRVRAMRRPRPSRGLPRASSISWAGGVGAHHDVEAELAQPALAALVARRDDPGGPHAVAGQLVQGRAVQGAQVRGDEGDVGQAGGGGRQQVGQVGAPPRHVRPAVASRAVTSSDLPGRLTAVRTAVLTAGSQRGARHRHHRHPRPQVDLADDVLDAVRGHHDLHGTVGLRAARAVRRLCGRPATETDSSASSRRRSRGRPRRRRRRPG